MLSIDLFIFALAKNPKPKQLKLDVARHRNLEKKYFIFRPTFSRYKGRDELTSRASRKLGGVTRSRICRLPACRTPGPGEGRFMLRGFRCAAVPAVCDSQSGDNSSLCLQKLLLAPKQDFGANKSLSSSRRRRKPVRHSPRSLHIAG